MSDPATDWTLTPGHRLTTALCLVPGRHAPYGNFNREWQLRTKIEEQHLAGLHPLACPGVIEEASQYPALLRQHAPNIDRHTLLYIEGHGGWENGQITRTRLNKNPWIPDPANPLNLTPGLLVVGACLYATQHAKIRAIVAPGTLVLASTAPTISKDVTTIIEPTIQALAANEPVAPDVVHRSDAGWALFRTL